MLDKSLNYLIPNKVEDLTRLGNNRDGGYVVPISSLKNCNFMISFGMAENFSMERDFLKFNNQNEIHMYDHTINNNYFYRRIYKSIKRLFYLKSSFKNIKNKLQDFEDYKNIINALALNLFYFVGSVIIFYLAFYGARKKGTLVNMGE